MSQSHFSLGFLSQNSLWKLSIFRGYKGLYIVGWERNAKSQFFPNRAGWQLGLVTWLSREFKPRVNRMARLDFLSCSAPAVVTVHLLCTLYSCAAVGDLPVASQLHVSTYLHNLVHFFTLSHSLPLYDSHLNTGLLIAKIQANLARNKANKMVDKIQPYNLPLWLFRDNTLKKL